MNEIPSNFYVIVGTLIIANIGSVISVFYGIGRAIWWASAMDKRVSFIETEYKRDIDAAHEAVRDLKKGVNYVNGNNN